MRCHRMQAYIRLYMTGKIHKNSAFHGGRSSLMLKEQVQFKVAKGQSFYAS